MEEKLPGSLKRYIAENNINFYTINAVKIAQEIGLGGRINMIMQSVFFKLANIIPVEDAIRYLKEAVVTSYGKKGEKVVNMNFAAIDAGINSVKKINVPDSWKDAKDKEEKTEMPIYVKLLIAVVLLVIILLAVLFSLLKYRQVKRRRARQLARKRKKALERRRSNTEQTGENAFRRQSKYPNKKPSGRRQKKRKLSQARQRRAVQINKFTVFAMSRRNHYAYEKGYIIKKEDE